MADLTTVILVKNEEKNLARCLKSLDQLGEILIIDDESCDQTLKIAKEFKAKTLNRKLDNYASQRNFALDNVKTEWVLFVDADEDVSLELRKEILEVIDSSAFSGFRIPRKNIIFNKTIEHAGWSPDFQLRLFKTEKGKYFREVHEVVEIEGEIGELKESLIHYNYQTVSQYFEKMLRYTSLEAENLKNTNYLFDWTDFIKKPLNEFLRRFFAEEGYKDGLHGLVLSMLQGFYEFMVILKVWENEKFVEKEIKNDVFDELKNSTKDLNYWINKIDKNPLRKILRNYLK